MKKIFGFTAAIAIMMSFSSCIRPYDKPEYVMIGTDETAFIIPLFTDSELTTDDQIVVNSEEYYSSKKLSEKLVQIPHKWIPTGRLANTGYYTPTMKVIVVSNSPVSGTWESAIKVETKGSQGITIPMKYTIRVEPQNAAKFLSKFPANKKLNDSKMESEVSVVADGQFRDFVAGKLSEEFHKYEYTDVNNNRDEIVSTATEKIIQWCDKYGITIDNLSVFDGLIYDDPTLQKQIDEQAKIAAQKLTEEKRGELLAVERANKEYEADTTVRVTNITANTYKIEQDKLDREQERRNSQIIAEAKAEALKNGKYAPVPETLIVQDLDALGSWNPEFTKGN